MMVQPEKEKAKGGLITAFKYMTGYYKETPTSYLLQPERAQEIVLNCSKRKREQVNSLKHRSEAWTRPDYIKGCCRISFLGGLFTQTTHSP